MRLCFPSLILAVERIILFEGKFVDFVTGRQELALPPSRGGLGSRGGELAGKGIENFALVVGSKLGASKDFSLRNLR